MADETVTTDAQTETAGATETGTATGTNGGQPPADARFTQADLERIIGERLTQERSKAAKLAEKQAAELEKKRLAENAEWQQLAEKTQAELATIKADAERLERVSAVVIAMYETRLKSLPAPLRKAVESLPVQDPLDRMQWLDANEQLFAQAQAVPDINAGSGGGSKPSPGVASLGGMDPQEFEARYGVRPKLS